MKLLGLILALLCIPTSIISAQRTSQDPRSIVERFCQETFNGARLSSLTRGSIDSLVLAEIWNDEPGWDSTYIVGGYKVGQTSIYGDSATVPVEYEFLGELVAARWIEADSTKFADSLRDKIITVLFSLVKTPSGWRIKWPVLPPFVSPEATLKHLEECKIHDYQYTGEESWWDPAIREMKKLIADRARMHIPPGLSTRR